MKFLMGHAEYRKYPYKFKLNSASCDDFAEDQPNVFFHCLRLTEEMKSLEETLGETVAPKSIIGKCLRRGM